MATKEVDKLVQKVPCIKSHRRVRRTLTVFCLLTSVLLIITTGCATSQNSMREPGLIESDGDAASNDSDATFTDEEFDLLEEELDEQEVKIPDPLEPVNRLMFGFNDVLYFWIFKPVAETCKAVVPEPVRLGVRNFFQNVATPVRYFNCLLQGKGQAAGTELHRLWVNTTEGILGFGDPAKDRYGLEPTFEDLGQTLAVHGMDSGFYIVWPFMGPSTVRDSLGKAGDAFLNPVRYVQPCGVSVGLSATRGINESSFHVGEYEEFKAASLEPYIAMREGYIQYRQESIGK
jgi:phospholipid-binding lipoprotein MlaA